MKVTKLATRPQVQLDFLDPAPAPAPTPAPERPPVIALPPPRSEEWWAALHLPALVFDAVFTQADAHARADVLLAVTEPVRRAQRIVAVNAAARERGVSPGMPLPAALALASALLTRARDPDAEHALLERLAAAAGLYTPRVSLEPPDALLLEVRGSVALFGGLESIEAGLRELARRLGVAAQLAIAPTPLSALVMARAADSFRVTEVRDLAGHLAPLPLSLLRLPGEFAVRFSKMGITRIGQALRLPRAGLARRFGPELITLLDRLAAREAEPRRVIAPRERFRQRLEPDHELSACPAILAFVAPMLNALEGFLRERQGSLAVLELRLHHREGRRSRCVLRFAQPAFLAESIAFLFAEKLAAMALPAPVIACELVSGRLVALRPPSAALWQPGEQGGGVSTEAASLIERLRARLGEDNVHGLGIVEGHRPERAWRIAEPVTRAAVNHGTGNSAMAGSAAFCADRPLWLLAAPEPLAMHEGWPSFEGRLSILSGPERIESGWWDDADVVRDYYVLRSAAGVSLWAYRERNAPHAWFLHGVFG